MSFVLGHYCLVCHRDQQSQDVPAASFKQQGVSSTTESIYHKHLFFKNNPLDPLLKLFVLNTVDDWIYTTTYKIHEDGEIVKHSGEVAFYEPDVKQEEIYFTPTPTKNKSDENEYQRFNDVTFRSHCRY